MASESLHVFVGTRKGLWTFKTDRKRAGFDVDGPRWLGAQIEHVVLDPRDGRTIVVGARTGHLGPTVYRSSDGGATFEEAKRPPAFPKIDPKPGEKAPAVDRVFWITPGHASEPGVWWAGTVPHALFRSEDGGASWDHVPSFAESLAALNKKIEGRIGPTPDGAITHSVLIDPRDRAHMYASVSGGGTFESLDYAKTWRPLNRGVEATFLPPDADIEFGQDPHCLTLAPSNPDRIWQQNHCGIYRLDRPTDTWVRIGKNMPEEVGDVGFPIVAHPRDAETAWVLPMDGTEVWPRTSPGGRPAVYRTRDGGRSWQRCGAGLPREQAWLTVKRQAMCADACDPVGLYFGTTSGELWTSSDEGEVFRRIAEHLPQIVSVTAGELA